ncbi:MotE family domain protein [Candidatus Bealeia paramacronuclearis]|uniref:MotE family domain protein n=1 Tax=Candidatus Bealeia paramacronuclearis TaxID=1921001 RepID=A0ABZ2C646_9PROT|nr:MotE family domain protein [Candidatus Bealeia paramacronuclearis]
MLGKIRFHKIPLGKIRIVLGRLPQVFTHSLQFRVRLLPLVIFCAVLMLSLRIYNIKRHFEGDSTASVVTTSLVAQASPAQPQASAQTSAPTSAPLPSVAETPNPEATPQKTKDSKKPFDPLSLTPEEIQVLQSLSQRRDEIEDKESSIKTREQLLKTMEDKIAQKLEDLKKLKGDIQGLVKTHDDKEQEKLKNLVKIYETMKPKDAARIMSQLDAEVLVNVAKQMKPAKISAIMSNMDPAIASGLTKELARRQDLTDKALKSSETQGSGSSGASGNTPAPQASTSPQVSGK